MNEKYIKWVDKFCDSKLNNKLDIYVFILSWVILFIGIILWRLQIYNMGSILVSISFIIPLTFGIIYLVILILYLSSALIVKKRRNK